MMSIMSMIAASCSRQKRFLIASAIDGHCPKWGEAARVRDRAGSEDRCIAEQQSSATPMEMRRSLKP
jgi:hypothetical protein